MVVSGAGPLQHLIAHLNDFIDAYDYRHWVKVLCGLTPMYQNLTLAVKEALNGSPIWFPNAVLPIEDV